jgi:hypothetical protein
MQIYSRRRERIIFLFLKYNNNRWNTIGLIENTNCKQKCLNWHQRFISVFSKWKLCKGNNHSLTL